MNRPRVIFHVHLYQPPRIDPWTGLHHVEPSASPWVDWNERIAMECYNRLRALPGVTGLINAYQYLSWDIGPFLLNYLAVTFTRTYRKLHLGARQHVTGLNPVVAHPLIHAILPLIPEPLARLLIRAGLAYLERTFRKKLTTLWLPELAVSPGILDICMDIGIKTVFVHPRAIHRIFRDPSTHTSIPARELHPDGLCQPFLYQKGSQSIILMPYHETLSASIAFHLTDMTPESWMDRLWKTIDAYRHNPVKGVQEPVVLIALDGETFGHHHPEGLQFLARLLPLLEQEKLLSTAESLSRPGPDINLARVEPSPESSWSCPHGFTRWRSWCECMPTLDDIDNDARNDWKQILYSSFSSLQTTLLHSLKTFDEIALSKKLLTWFPASAQIESESDEVPTDMLDTGLLMSSFLWSSDGWFFERFLRPEPFYLLIFADYLLCSLPLEVRDATEGSFHDALYSIELNHPKWPNALSLFFDKVRKYRKSRRDSRHYIHIFKKEILRFPYPAYAPADLEAFEHPRAIIHSLQKSPENVELLRQFLNSPLFSPDVTPADCLRFLSLRLPGSYFLFLSGKPAEATYSPDTYASFVSDMIAQPAEIFVVPLFFTLFEMIEKQRRPNNDLKDVLYSLKHADLLPPWITSWMNQWDMEGMYSDTNEEFSD